MSAVSVGGIAELTTNDAGLGPLTDAALVVEDGVIAWVGRESMLPPADDHRDLGGRAVLPGFVDSHSHLVFAGDRSAEFAARMAGTPYDGGGISSTVAATRAASDDELVGALTSRVAEMRAQGTTTIEIKSGYGLDLANERKSLRAARRLGQERPVGVRTTFLGAHALPPEAAGDRGGYIARLVAEMLPAIAAEGLADAVDGFCEGISFSPDEVARVFTAAKALGLPVKLHADQLSNLHGAALAASFGALSADHLEHTDEAGVAAMAEAGTVATLLPGAYYFIRETKQPPIELFRRHGVAMAIATDCNPGTSPLTSLLLTMNMAATFFRLTVDECLLGVTRHAAKALGRLESIGTLEAGKSCDLALWDIERPAELVYRIGFTPLHQRVWKGQ